jgi:hypothetical protein
VSSIPPGVPVRTVSLTVEHAPNKQASGRQSLASRSVSAPPPYHHFQIRMLLKSAVDWHPTQSPDRVHR